MAEQRIAGFPEVAEALLVGTRRPKAALVLRLEDGGVVDDALWGKIEEVNGSSPVYARVQNRVSLGVAERLHCRQYTSSTFRRLGCMRGSWILYTEGDVRKRRKRKGETV